MARASVLPASTSERIAAITWRMAGLLALLDQHGQRLLQRQPGFEQGGELAQHEADFGQRDALAERQVETARAFLCGRVGQRIQLDHEQAFFAQLGAGETGRVGFDHAGAGFACCV